MISTILNPILSLFSATSCTVKPDVWGIPTWYKYLEGYEDPITKACSPLYKQAFEFDDLVKVAGIGLAVIEILIRLVTVTAIIWVIWGGFQYLISQGEPDRAKAAKDTILNAVIGIIIAMFANVIVVFVGRSLTS